MWIILLDHSGSMGDPFEETNLNPDESIRSFEANVKLDAAKKSVLFQLKRLDVSIPVALVGFTSKAHLIYEGTAGEYEIFEEKLNEIEATNGTNIAVALDYAYQYINEKNETIISPRITMITDGLSDLDQAKNAAGNCINSGICIDILLIDPTEEGKTLARAISGIAKGQWDSVTSSDILMQRTEKSVRQMTNALAQVQLIKGKVNNEVREVETVKLGKRKLLFTAGYPSSIKNHGSYPLIVYTHLFELLDEVKEKLNKEFGKNKLPLSSFSVQSKTEIERGKTILFRPDIKNIKCNPSQIEITWLNDCHKIEFGMNYFGEEQSDCYCEGFVDVFIDGVIISQIPISTMISFSKQNKSKQEYQIKSAKIFNRVFASYSRKDLKIVQACKLIYKALGIYLYIDKDDLFSGMDWSSALTAIIKESDLFQLYWSKNSSESAAVEDEWRLALRIAKNKPWEFIRPFYWEEPIVKPPIELSNIQFSYLDLKIVESLVDNKVCGTSANNAWPDKIPMIYPIISPISNVENNMLDKIQTFMARVIPFLEGITHLHYYIPPTIITNEYFSLQVKYKVDEHINLENGDITWALDVLQALALLFHVGTIEGSVSINKDIYSQEYKSSFYDVESGNDYSDFHHVRNMCEYFFNLPLRSYIVDRTDPFKTYKRDRLGKINEAMRNHERIYNLESYLSVVNDEDREKIEGIIGSKLDLIFEEYLLSNGKNGIFDLFLTDECQLILKKYASDFYCFFGGGYSHNFCECNNFDQYTSKLFDLWIRYIETAYRKFGNIKLYNRYGIEKCSSDRFRNLFPNINFSEKLSEGSTDKYSNWTISLDNYLKAIKVLKQIIFKKHYQEDFWEFLSTFGAFISAIKESEDFYNTNPLQPYGVQSNMIVLSLNAFKRLEETQFNKHGKMDNSSIIDRFIESVLVHEHFHGILETGIDCKWGSASGASNDNNWKNASLLNEALAVWFQWHYFREDREIYDIIKEYIYLGEYPEWPYRGAEFIEKIYTNKGIYGIKKIIDKIREDPAFTQALFDLCIN